MRTAAPIKTGIATAGVNMLTINPAPNKMNPVRRMNFLVGLGFHLRGTITALNPHSGHGATASSPILSAPHAGQIG